MNRHRSFACGLCLFLLLMIVVGLYGQDFSAAKNTESSIKGRDSTRAIKSPTGAMLRSMIIPGWGQLYNQKPFKALLIGGSEIGLGINIALQHQWAKRAATENDRAFYLNNRNLSVWYLAALILYSMADAYVDAHLFDFDESPNLSVSPAEWGDGIEPFFALGLRISYHF